MRTFHEAIDSLRFFHRKEPLCSQNQFSYLVCYFSAFSFP